MAPMFLLFLFLPQFKLALLFFLSFLTIKSFADDLFIFLFCFQSLLGLGAQGLVFQLPMNFPLHPLGIDPLFWRFFITNRLAELEPVIIFKQKIVDFPVFGFRTKGHLGHFQGFTVCTFKDAYPKGVVKKTVNLTVTLSIFNSS